MIERMRRLGQGLNINSKAELSKIENTGSLIKTGSDK